MAFDFADVAIIPRDYRYLGSMLLHPPSLPRQRKEQAFVLGNRRSGSRFIRFVLPIREANGRIDSTFCFGPSRFRGRSYDRNLSSGQAILALRRMDVGIFLLVF